MILMFNILAFITKYACMCTLYSDTETINVRTRVLWAFDFRNFCLLYNQH
jgi:hypothetical protein